MPRPCQQRRASAAANRKSKPSKPAGPPPIRHKAKQKAIHNARRGRGGRGGRGGGRGGNNGGRFSQNNNGHASQNQQSRGNNMEEDFIPLSGGNDFNALYRASRDDDIVLEDGELSSDSETDSDDIDEDDMHDADDIAINVQAGLPLTSFSRPGKAQVMFTVAEAVVKFETMRRAGYPLNLPTTRTRYGLFQEDTTPHSGTNISSAPSPASRRLSVSSATSEEAAAAPTARVPPPTIAAPRARAVPEAPAPAAQPETYNPGRDYVFNWGINSGKRFADILANPSDPYLKTIGGQLYIFVDKHPGLKEAFEYYKSHFMPGQIRFTRPVQAQSQSSYNQVQQQAPQTQTRPSQAGPSRSQPPPSAPRGPRNPSSNGHSSGSSSGPPRGAPSGPSSGPSRGAPNGTSSRSSISNTWRFPKGMHKGKTLHDVDEHYIKTMGGNPKIRQSWSGFAEALQDYREKTQTQSRA